MYHPNPTAGLPSPPDPPRDRAGETVPGGIPFILGVLNVLLTYGNHLLATLECRAAQRSFATIAQCFGTRSLPIIIARVTLGIRRAIALRNVLLARAADGYALFPDPPPEYRHPPQRSFAPTGRLHRPGSDLGTRPAPATHPDPEEPPEPVTIPTVDQLQAEIADQPVGKVIADICRDLGVSPFRCEQRFNKTLYQAIRTYGGDHLDLCGDMLFRSLDLAEEMARNGHPDLDWPPYDQEPIRRIVGFDVGEEPVCPFPLPAMPGLVEPVAAGPP